MKTMINYPTRPQTLSRNTIRVARLPQPNRARRFKFTLALALAVLALSARLFADLSSGLVASYPFNGDANDASGNGNDGTVNGATFVAGYVGQALSFDGLNDEVVVPDSPSLNPTVAISIIVSFKANSYSNISARLLQKGYDDNQYSLRFQTYPTPEIIFEVSGPADELLFAPAPSVGVWHHIAATYNGSQKKIYVDGVLVASKAVSGLLATSTDDLAIGNKPRWTDPIDYFDGLIDEVRIYNRALSDWEVRQLCGSVAYWPFDGNVNDLSGNGNHGTNHGVVFVADRFGITNGAGSFGNDGYVEVPDSLSLQIVGTNISVAAWVYPTQYWAGGKSSIVQKMGFPAGSGGYVVGITDDGRLQFGGVFDTTGEWQDVKTASYRVRTNAWSHVAVTYDGQAVRYYLNGTLVDSTPFAGQLQASSQPLAIGRITPDYLGEVFYGKIDELQISSRTLSSAEVAALYSEPGLSIAVSHVRLCWDSRTNKNYQIQYRSVLTLNEWLNLGSPIPGNGGTQCVTDEIVSPQRFYRAIMVP